MPLFGKKPVTFDEWFDRSKKSAEEKKKRGEYPYDNPVSKAGKPPKKDRRKKK